MKTRPYAILLSVLFFLMMPFLLNVDAAPTQKDSIDSDDSTGLSQLLESLPPNFESTFNADVAYWEEFFERKPQVLHALNAYLSKFPPPPSGVPGNAYYASLLSLLNEALTKEQEGISSNTEMDPIERPVINSPPMLAKSADPLNPNGSPPIEGVVLSQDTELTLQMKILLQMQQDILKKQKQLENLQKVTREVFQKLQKQLSVTSGAAPQKIDRAVQTDDENNFKHPRGKNSFPGTSSARQTSFVHRVSMHRRHPFNFEQPPPPPRVSMNPRHPFNFEQPPPPPPRNQNEIEKQRLNKQLPPVPNHSGLQPTHQVYWRLERSQPTPDAFSSASSSNGYHGVGVPSEIWNYMPFEESVPIY